MICRVTGLFAFGSRNDGELMERIKSGSFIRSDQFNRLTKKCQDFIINSLNVNPKKRYSADDALRDEWIWSDENNDSPIIPNEPGMNYRMEMVSSKRRNG